MHTRLNWRSALFIAALVFFIIPVFIILSDPPDFLTAPFIALYGSAGFFFLLMMVPVVARLRRVPRTMIVADRLYEQFQILKRIFWGLAGVSFATLLLLVVYYVLWTRIGDERIFVISGFGAVSFALAPIVNALHIEEEAADLQTQSLDQEVVA